MCLIAWNWQPGSAMPLLLIANRDEFYARPAAPLHGWMDVPILAGRDLQAGGTWLGISRRGRVAALTNYRDPTRMRSDAPSRGALVSGFLASDLSALDYLTVLAPQAGDYNPFNLLVFDGQQLLGLESRHNKVLKIQPGVGAVSNADFQTPWPKLTALKTGLQGLLDHSQLEEADLLGLLQNRQIAPDSELPYTGIARELERALSATFIATPHYGTRACSVLRLAQEHIDFAEHSYAAQGATGVQRLRVNTALQNAPPSGLGPPR